MQLSAFHPVPRQVSQSRWPNAQRAVPAGQSFVRFTSGDSKKTPDKTEKQDDPKAERKSIGRTLFGSPLKNVGWSILYGAGGGVAFFVLPPAGLALLAVGALHGMVAIWQFIKQGKTANDDKPNSISEVPVNPEPTPVQYPVDAYGRFVQKYTRPVSQSEEKFLDELVGALGRKEPDIEKNVKKRLTSLGLSDQLMERYQHIYRQVKKGIIRNESSSVNYAKKLLEFVNLHKFARYLIVGQNSPEKIMETGAEQKREFNGYLMSFDPFFMNDHYWKPLFELGETYSQRLENKKNSAS